jgi:hypothetical protein
MPGVWAKVVPASDVAAPARRPWSAGEKEMNMIHAQFTEDEILVLLGCAVKGIANFGIPQDPEDRESLLQLRAAADKLRRMVDMDQKTFLMFCNAAAGKVPEEIVRVFIEEDAKRKRDMGKPVA